jgi:hypothetical protein
MAKERKYGNVTVENKSIPEDEPVFLFRAQDELASAALRYYAALRSADGDTEGARRVMFSANDFDRWPKKKRPD